MQHRIGVLLPIASFVVRDLLRVCRTTNFAGRRKLILKNYCKTYLFIDLVSLLPLGARGLEWGARAGRGTWLPVDPC